MGWNEDNQVWNLSNPYGSAVAPAYDVLAKQQSSLGSNDRMGLVTRLTDVGNQFKTQFTNLVGRAPTSDEIGQFYRDSAGSIISNTQYGRSENDPTGVRNAIQAYTADNFQKAANDTATQKLTDQQGQANQLADMFRTQGNQAISSTEQSLLDYQQKLFERLRPNLITSLDAQGLLDTGGLNQALAGAQQNLATSAQGALLDAHMQNEQGANQIAFGGASAPYYFQQNQITQQPAFLQQMGQNAVGMNYNTYMNDLNYQHQISAMGYQSKLANDAKPSFLDTLGQSFATSLGTSGGQWFSPNPGGAQGGQSGPATAMKLFAS